MLSHATFVSKNIIVPCKSALRFLFGFPTKSNIIELTKSCVFDFAGLPNTIERLCSIKFDWVRLKQGGLAAGSGPDVLLWHEKSYLAE